MQHTDIKAIIASVSASVIVNDNRGTADAGGTMYFGDAATPAPVATVFDGSVLVRDCD